MMRRRAMGWVAGLLVSTTVMTGVTAQPASAAASLTSKIAALLEDGTVTGKGDKTGVVVVDTSDGRTVFQRNASAAIAPASNMKLVTAAAALDLLGPEFRFHTDVYAARERVDGVVQGDLYVKGFGDPTLSPADLTELARQVRAMGITAVTGRIVADASLFDDQRTNPGWRKEFFGQPDSAEISALTLRPDGADMPNTVAVNYQPTSVGRRAALSITPASAASHVKLVNKTTTTGAGSRTTIRLARKTGTNTITVSGGVGAGRPKLTQYVAVTDPARYAARVLRAQLTSVGVKVAGGVTRGATPAATTVRVGTLSSGPLTDIVHPVLKHSINTYSEVLTKRLGATLGQGSWQSGTARLQAWLQANAVPTDKLLLTDGSGLAASNRLTPAAIIAVLRQAQAAPWWPSYYAALPIAGIRDEDVGGSLHNRMIGSAAANNVRAKTGTIRGVTALSGYATGKNGRLYAFSMLSQYSGASPVGVSDKLAVLLAGWKNQE